MEISQTKAEIEDLLENNINGLYTSAEVVSNVLDILSESNISELWDELPSWLREKIVLRLTDFSEGDEIVTFGRGDSEIIKKQNLLIKSWLQKNNKI